MMIMKIKNKMIQSATSQKVRTANLHKHRCVRSAFRPGKDRKRIIRLKSSFVLTQRAAHKKKQQYPTNLSNLEKKNKFIHKKKKNIHPQSARTHPFVPPAPRIPPTPKTPPFFLPPHCFGTDMYGLKVLVPGKKKTLTGILSHQRKLSRECNPLV